MQGADTRSGNGTVERVGAAQEQDTLVLGVKCDALVHADEADAGISLGSVVITAVGGIDGNTSELGVYDVLTAGPLDKIRCSRLEFGDSIAEGQVERGAADGGVAERTGHGTSER